LRISRSRKKELGSAGVPGYEDCDKENITVLNPTLNLRIADVRVGERTRLHSTQNSNAEQQRSYYLLPKRLSIVKMNAVNVLADWRHVPSTLCSSARECASRPLTSGKLSLCASPSSQQQSNAALPQFDVTSCSIEGSNMRIEDCKIARLIEKFLKIED